MKKLLPRFLALLLVITMLPIGAFASLENHNVSDVTIVQSETQDNYYFPDITMLPDGRLLVCFYRAQAHVASGSYGTIYLVESTDNGYTWSEPWKVVDRTAENFDSRDPNLATLPDGTVVLTYFGSGKTFMLFSVDGGRTWSEQIELVSDILDTSISKRGTIAVINNENMLIPCYGKSSGVNAYGAPATATGQGQFSSYHADAVVLHYQKNTAGEWVCVNESLLGQEIDETALMYTGTGTMIGDTTFDGEVYAFSREDGTVRVSHDCANTWTVIAKEEPRSWTTTGTIMSAEQIIQPRFVKISDDCWFATYANVETSLDYTCERYCRAVYGKVFFPKAGWYATTSQLIYDHVGHGSLDMADPATVLTAEGKLLTIYYDTSTKSISGTFSELSEWVDLEESSTDTELVQRSFWDGALSGEELAGTVFDFGGSGWSWSDAGIFTASNGNSFTGKETISNNYTVQFDFILGGTSGDTAANDRDEGINILPLYNSTNPNITSGYKYRIRLSSSEGVQLIYHSNSNGDYGGVLAGVRGPSDSTDTLYETLDRNKLYTMKISKIGDGLYLKVWKAEEAEPAWQCEYHHASIGSADGAASDAAYTWTFSAQFCNKGTDSENMCLSDLSFWQIVETPWNWDGSFTQSSYLENCTDRSGFIHGAHAVWSSDDDGVRVYKSSYLSTTPISGEYTFQTNFSFGEETSALSTDANRLNNGLTIWPQYHGSGAGNDSYRIVLSTNRGLELGYSSVLSPGSWGVISETTAAESGTTYTFANDNTSFTAGTDYTLKFTKSDGSLYVKVWLADQAEPEGWDYVIAGSSNLSGSTAYPFRMYYSDTQYVDSKMGITLSGMDFNGVTVTEEPFWEAAFSEKTSTQALFTTTSGWRWMPKGYTVTGTSSSIASKPRLSGDYTTQFDFILGGESADAAASDRDEGLIVYPLYNTDNPNIDSGYTYRIRLSTTQGAQLLYNPYYSASTVGVLGGYDYSTDSQIGNLPATLAANTRYTLKLSKIGDGLYLKVWETGTEEPDQWQCEHHDDSVDVEGSSYSWNFYIRFYNLGTDTENARLSDMCFARYVEKTVVNSVNVKEDTRWIFWQADMTAQTAAEAVFETTGIWNWTTEGAVSGGSDVSLSSLENISGSYTAEMNFKLGGAGAGEDGLYLYPLNGSTNPACTESYKVRLSAADGLQLFYGSELMSSYTDACPNILTAGTEYTLKLSKSYDCLYIKVWPAAEAEPLGWHCIWQDASVGSAVKYVAGTYSQPYDFSANGENDADGDPYQWSFLIRHVDSQGTANVTLSDLEFSKDVVMDVNYTELTVNLGETSGNVEMNTVFYPNIFKQLPMPEGRVQYSSRNGNVTLTPINGVRIQRAYVTGVTVGSDTIIASYPGIVDGQGSAAIATCAVTVREANPSAEFKGTDAGYTTQILFSEDFEDVPVYANHMEQTEGTCDWAAENANYNALSEFFEYLPFYSFSKQAVLEDTMSDTANRYLQAYCASGSGAAAIRLRSLSKIQGDFTFQADVKLPSGSAEFRLALTSQEEKVLDGGSTYVFATGLTSWEKTVYADYEYCFRTRFSRARLHGIGLQLCDDPTADTNWQTIKAVKAGDTLYFKSWRKGTTEPTNWEFIILDPRIAAADSAKNGGWLTLEIVTGYTNPGAYNESLGSVMLDNIVISRQIAAE